MSHHIVAPGEGTVYEVLGDRITCKTPGADTGNFWSLFEFQSPKDSGPPPHRHPWTEAYYMLEGEVAFHAEGRTVKAVPGCYIHVPPMVVHHSKVLSPSCRFLMWAAPAGAERFFADLAKNAADNPPDFGKILAIAAKHNVEAIG